MRNKCRVQDELDPSVTAWLTLMDSGVRSPSVSGSNGVREIMRIRVAVGGKMYIKSFLWRIRIKNHCQFFGIWLLFSFQLFLISEEVESTLQSWFMSVFVTSARSDESLLMLDMIVLLGCKGASRLPASFRLDFAYSRQAQTRFGPEWIRVLRPPSWPGITRLCRNVFVSLLLNPLFLFAVSVSCRQTCFSLSPPHKSVTSGHALLRTHLWPIFGYFRGTDDIYEETAGQLNATYGRRGTHHHLRC